MTVKPLPAQKKQSAFSYGLSFAAGFWITSLFFVPPVVAVGLITYAVLNALF